MAFPLFPFVYAGAARAAAPRTLLPVDPGGEDWEGLAQFVRLAQKELGPKRALAEQRLELGVLRGEDAIIVVHPDGPLEAEELSAFMAAGGRCSPRRLWHWERPLCPFRHLARPSFSPSRPDASR